MRIGGPVTNARTRAAIAAAAAGSGGAPARPTAEPALSEVGSRRFGTPSSLTRTARSTGFPTLTVTLVGPSILTAGGLFARISGLLDPAPRAPVSEAFTTSSTL